MFRRKTNTKVSNPINDLAALTHEQRAVLAGTMSITSAFVNTPFRFLTRSLQLSNDKVRVEQDGKNKLEQVPNSRRPTTWWRGTSVNVMRSFPNVVARVLVLSSAKSFLAEQNRLPSPAEKILPTLAAGLISTTINTPCDLVIDRRQTTKKSCLTIAREVVRNHGIRNGLFRAFSPKAWQHSAGALSYWNIAPELKIIINKHTKNETVATLAANVAVGVPTSALTHPLDTISTHMQNDLKQESYKHSTQTAAKIYQEKGMKGLFKGVAARVANGAVGYAIAGVTQYLVTRYYKNKKNKNVTAA